MFLAYLKVSLLGKVLEFKLLDTLEFTSKRKCIFVVVQERGIGALQLLTKGANEIFFPTLCLGTQSNVVLAFTIPTSFSSPLATLTHVENQGLNVLVYSSSWFGTSFSFFYHVLRFLDKIY
jgi:magnesium-transporting ATPase (P-type)